MPELIALAVSLALLVLIVAPPVMALYMLALRLRLLPADRRMPYQALAALAGIVGVFNLLVWLGMPRALAALLPDLIDRNLGICALLAAWAAVGLCLMLAVLVPIHRSSKV